MYLDELTSEEFERKIKNGCPIILPVGATEAHGPHLPLNTDSLQPEYIAEAIAKELNVLIAPPIRYGVCRATASFPGTLSLSFDTIRRIIEEVLEELVRNGAKLILVLSGHAGRAHMAAIREAATEVASTHKCKILVLSDYDIAYKLRGKLVPEEDGHAGTLETSRVMAIRGDLVKELPEPYHPEYPQYLILTDIKKYLPRCYHGDPRAASAELGERVNSIIVREIIELLRRHMNGD